MKSSIARPGVIRSVIAGTLAISTWLVLLAAPVAADGGPHVAGSNSGFDSLTSDSCAGCHRTHTAVGPNLLTAPTVESLCLSCHGETSQGATTNIEGGVQYRPTGAGTRPTLLRTVVQVTDGTISTSVAHGFQAGQVVAVTGLDGVADGDHAVGTVTATTLTLVGQTPTNRTYTGNLPTIRGSDASLLLGALRNGGFVRSAIDSSTPARVLRADGLAASDDHWAKVRVRTTSGGVVSPAPVTSAHLNLASNGLSAPGIAWGNGPVGSGFNGPGPTADIDCTSCHNPHGNQQFRILNPIPVAGDGGFVPSPTQLLVTDSPVDTIPNNGVIENPTKNYTVIQKRGTPGQLNTYLLYASDVITAGHGPATGDYWHVRVPWNQASSATNGNDAPNGINATGPGVYGFNDQITAWCSGCHTRYYSANGGVPTIDAIYTYRHETIGNRACTTCHVAHGSNARMDGTFSGTQPFPDGSVPRYTIGGTETGDSRLLKVDGRGTCQLCHDPTYTAFESQPYTGPSPTPGAP